jgi:hypothetical protein
MANEKNNPPPDPAKAGGAGGGSSEAPKGPGEAAKASEPPPKAVAAAPQPATPAALPRDPRGKHVDKPCVCGAPLGDHTIEPPHGNASTGCARFHLVTGEQAQGPLPTPVRRGKAISPICGCGTTLAEHDKNPPHGNHSAGCARFALLR